MTFQQYVPLISQSIYFIIKEDNQYFTKISKIIPGKAHLSIMNMKIIKKKEKYILYIILGNGLIVEYFIDIKDDNKKHLTYRRTFPVCLQILDEFLNEEELNTNIKEQSEKEKKSINKYTNSEANIKDFEFFGGRHWKPFLVKNFNLNTFDNNNFESLLMDPYDYLSSAGIIKYVSTNELKKNFLTLFLAQIHGINFSKNNNYCIIGGENFCITIVDMDNHKIIDSILIKHIKCSFKENDGKGKCETRCCFFILNDSYILYFVSHLEKLYYRKINENYEIENSGSGTVDIDENQNFIDFNKDEINIINFNFNSKIIQDFNTNEYTYFISQNKNLILITKLYLDDKKINKITKKIDIGKIIQDDKPHNIFVKKSAKDKFRIYFINPNYTENENSKDEDAIVYIEVIDTKDIKDIKVVKTNGSVIQKRWDEIQKEKLKMCCTLSKGGSKKDNRRKNSRNRNSKNRNSRRRNSKKRGIRRRNSKKRIIRRRNSRKRNSISKNKRKINSKKM